MQAPLFGRCLQNLAGGGIVQFLASSLLHQLLLLLSKVDSLPRRVGGSLHLRLDQLFLYFTGLLQEKHRHLVLREALWTA
jgi:hypothetical protein